MKATTGKGKTHTKRRPVFEAVDPLRHLYVRRLKIRNDAEHILHLDRAETVLVDAAGNDNKGMTKGQLRRFWRAARPCPSTRRVIASLRGLKFLGSNIRILPGRVARVLVAFPRIDKRILGDWALEIHGLPVDTDNTGKYRVSRPSRFPLHPRLSNHHRNAQGEVARPVAGDQPQDRSDKAGLISPRVDAEGPSSMTRRGGEETTSAM